MMSFLKSLALALGIIAVLKWRIADRKVEDHIFSWWQSPAVQSRMDSMLSKVEDLSQKTYQQAKRFYHEHFCETPKPEHK